MKNAHHQHTRLRREKQSGHPTTWGRSADENSHRDPGTTIMRKSPKDMKEGQPSSRTRRSSRTALVRRDPAPALHHRRNRRAARIRDHTTHRHHLCRGCGRKVARGRDDATTPVCHRLKSKGIEGRDTHRLLSHGEPAARRRTPPRTRHRSLAPARRRHHHHCHGSPRNGEETAPMAAICITMGHTSTDRSSVLRN
jgi:hypothetical protein